MNISKIWLEMFIQVHKSHVEELFYPTPLIVFFRRSLYSVSIGAHAKSKTFGLLRRFPTDPHEIWHTYRAPESATFRPTDFRYLSPSRFLGHFSKNFALRV